MMTLSRALEAGIAPWQDQRVDLGAVKVFADAYPVTVGHRLFVPERDHPDDIAACFRQAMRYGQLLVEQGACEAFNVGMNWGRAAGQTIMYPHVHCIPRRAGDCDDPTGCVRGVIAHQQNYRSPLYQHPHQPR